MVIDEKGRIWRDDVDTEDMSSAEVTAEAEATYGQLHN